MSVRRYGRILVALALLTTSVPLASYVSCVPRPDHVTRLDHVRRSHVRIHRNRTAAVQKASPARDPNYDPFADMILG